MVEGQLLMLWAVGSIPPGVPIELFFIPARAPQMELQRLWYVLSLSVG